MPTHVIPTKHPSRAVAGGGLQMERGCPSSREGGGSIGVCAAWRLSQHSPGGDTGGRC